MILAEHDIVVVVAANQDNAVANQEFAIAEHENLAAPQIEVVAENLVAP